MYKVTFYINKPEACTHEQFMEFLRSELSTDDLIDNNPLEFYELSNSVKNLTIEFVQEFV
jgi:hypothetical protein